MTIYDNFRLSRPSRKQYIQNQIFEDLTVIELLYYKINHINIHDIHTVLPTLTDNPVADLFSQVSLLATIKCDMPQIDTKVNATNDNSSNYCIEQ